MQYKAYFLYPMNKLLIQYKVIGRAAQMLINVRQSVIAEIRKNAVAIRYGKWSQIWTINSQN